MSKNLLPRLLSPISDNRQTSRHLYMLVSPAPSRQYSPRREAESSYQGPCPSADPTVQILKPMTIGENAKMERCHGLSSATAVRGHLQAHSLCVTPSRAHVVSSHLWMGHTRMCVFTWLKRRGRPSRCRRLVSHPFSFP